MPSPGSLPRSTQDAQHGEDLEIIYSHLVCKGKPSFLAPSSARMPLGMRSLVPWKVDGAQDSGEAKLHRVSRS